MDPYCTIDLEGIWSFCLACPKKKKSDLARSIPSPGVCDHPDHQTTASSPHSLEHMQARKSALIQKYGAECVVEDGGAAQHGQQQQQNFSGSNWSGHAGQQQQPNWSGSNWSDSDWAGSDWSDSNWPGYAGQQQQNWPDSNWETSGYGSSKSQNGMNNSSANNQEQAEKARTAAEKEAEARSAEAKKVRGMSPEEKGVH